MHNDKTILIVNDFTGCGKVSTATMIPIMSLYGFHTYSLPTAVVSNTLDYGKFEILDTTDFMRNAVDVWDNLGFRFDNIATGLINSDEQIDIICNLIDKQEHPFVMVDPIMAEDGVLYPGMYPNVVECNRRLASRADLLIPNLTEAELLTDMYIGRDRLTHEEYNALYKALLDLGPKSIVISGCITAEDGEAFNLVYEPGDSDYSKVTFDRINETFIGTGDIFSSVLYSEYIMNGNLHDSVKKASDFVRTVIVGNLDNPDHFDLRFEKHLHELF